MEFKDKVGNILVPGDIIVSSQLSGHHSELRYAKVTGIVEKDNGRRPFTKLKIIAAEDAWFSRGPQLLTKESLLEHPNRILRITEDQIPDKVLKLLKEYTPKVS